MPALDQHVGSRHYAAIRSAHDRSIVTDADNQARITWEHLFNGRDQAKLADFRDRDECLPHRHPVASLLRLNLPPTVALPSHR